MRSLAGTGVRRKEEKSKRHRDLYASAPLLANPGQSFQRREEKVTPPFPESGRNACHSCRDSPGAPGDRRLLVHLC